MYFLRNDIPMLVRTPVLIVAIVLVLMVVGDSVEDIATIPSTVLDELVLLKTVFFGKDFELE